MNLKTLIAAAVAAAFPLSFAHAAGDKDKVSGEKSTPVAKSESSAKPTKADAAEAMFVQMDKNKDGFVTKEEAKGTPHEKDFAKLDRNHDGKLSRAEHAAAPEHSGKKDKSAAVSGSTTSPSASAPSAEKKKY